MRIRLCGEGDRDRWKALVEASRDATLGHIWEWREVAAAAYGFASLHLIAEDSDGMPVAALPFIIVRSRLYGTELTSMPYIDYGGICHSEIIDMEARPQVDELMFTYALELARAVRAKRLQVRTLKPSDPRLQISTEKVTQHLALAKTPAEQLRRLPSERRNRLRRCERLGLTTEVVPTSDERGLFDFCHIYETNMRDLGSPSHSRQFFHEVARRLGATMSLIIIRNSQMAVAAALVLEFRGEMSLPWSGALLSARSVYGTNALYWAAIRLGIERGCHTFDFGRSSIGSGIYEFKRQWGPKPHQVYWSTFYLKSRSKSPRRRAELRLASSLWRYVPLGLANVVGPSLRKGISN